jgi:hypothetical protein
MKFIEIIQYVAIFSLIFSTFFLAIRGFSEYILHNKQTKQTMNENQIKEIDALIAATKGKFFSITFEKKDGTIRTINGKDRYERLIKGTGSPATTALREAGFKSAIDRNKESWFSFQPAKVKTFKCGQIEKNFSV